MREAVALSIFLAALLAESWILEMTDMSELTAWNSAEWHFRGFCNDCQGYRTLAPTAWGDLCEACDLDRMLSTDADDYEHHRAEKQRNAFGGAA